MKRVAHEGSYVRNDSKYFNLADSIPKCNAVTFGSTEGCANQEGCRWRRMSREAAEEQGCCLCSIVYLINTCKDKCRAALYWFSKSNGGRAMRRGARFNEDHAGSERGSMKHVSADSRVVKRVSCLRRGP